MATTPSRNTEERPPAIKLDKINKSFGLVHANRDVSLQIKPGTIHGIVGENGAGKSTLMSILYGFYHADSGSIEVNGKKVEIKNSSDAIRLGIGMVHQHFMLVPVFSVLDNVLLGVEGGALLEEGRKKALTELGRLGSEYGLEVDPHELIENLPVGIRQRVEILKALYRGAEILILDEPTGVLTPQEADRLFDILRTLRERGETVVLITHKLREIMAATDNVSVMRNGELVADRKTSETSPEDLAELMVGRKVLLEVDKKPREAGEVALEVKDLEVEDKGGIPRVKGVSFSIREGEILGVAGVSGNGQSTLLEALAGIQAPSKGSVRVGGRTITAKNPSDPAEMRKLGMCHVPEDRHESGLVMDFPAEDSLILGHHYYDRYLSYGLLSKKAVLNNAEEAMPRFDVRPQDPKLRSADFSGGNQQKIVLAREISDGPKVFIVGQPTRGVDIGAIEAIHSRLLEMREEGCAILLVSFELDEVMSLSDRIIVLNAGKIVGEVAASETDELELGLMMAGVESGK